MTWRARTLLVAKRCLYEVFVAACAIPAVAYLLLDQHNGLDQTSLAQLLGPAVGVTWAIVMLAASSTLLAGVALHRPAMRRAATLGLCLTVCAYGAALIPNNGAIAAFAGSFFLASGAYLATRHGGA